MRPHIPKGATDRGTIRLALIEAEPAARFGIRQYFHANSCFQICFESASILQADAQFAKIRPDVALVDVDLDGGGGLHFIQRIGRPPHCIPSVAIARDVTRAKLAELVRAQPRAVVSRREDLNEFLLAAICVLAGYRHLGIIAATSASDVMLAPDASAGSINLPARQRQVFRLLSEGQSTSTIAKRLGVSLKTVQSHIERMKHKLHCRSHTELVARAALSEIDQAS